ncbi:MAG: transporter [Acidobacteriota bacterium]
MTGRRTGAIAGVLLLATWAPVGPALAAPLTFNTALPVARGEGILRIQFRRFSSTGGPGAQDRELTVRAFPLVGVYGASGKLALFAIAPIIDKTLELTTPMGRRTRNVSGLGDTAFLARYTTYRRDRPGRTTRVAPFVGVEAPTGEDAETDELGRLPRALQLGSGSWDYRVGTIATWQTLRWQLDGSISYQLNTEANDFEFGDEARLDLSYQYRVWPRELGEGVPAFLYAILESNVVWQDRDVVDGLEDPDSGGVTWFLAPGLQFVRKRLVVEAAVQIPVERNLNGAAPETDFITTLSVRVNL